MRLLLDTHVWIWMLMEPDRLAPRTAKTLQDRANELWLSPISVWELVMVVQKGRLELGISVEEWIARAWSAAPTKEVPLTAEVVLATRQLSLRHRDPADMFLAATAKVHKLTLVTSDAHLLAAKGIALLQA